MWGKRKKGRSNDLDDLLWRSLKVEEVFVEGGSSDLAPKKQSLQDL